MAAPGRSMVAVFALAGFASGLVIVPLALLWMPIVFVCEGALFALGFALGYAACRRALPRVGALRFCGALFVLAIGYPVAIGFGGALSLATQFLMQKFAGLTPAVQDAAPLTILGFLLFWGALSAAFFVKMALTLITCEWDNRVLLLLAVAGILSAGVSLGVYLFFYDSPDPTITRYRELALFGVMAPLGNAAFGAVCACGIKRAMRTEMRAAASA